MSRRICIACLVASFALAAAPVAGIAQTSSQTQYGGVAGEVIGGGGDDGPSATSPGSKSGSEPAAAVSPATEADSGSLPFTGLDLLVIALAGAGLLALGVVLRRSTRREAA